VKPPPFRYRRPADLDEALALLAEPGAVALAGGQDLVPLLNSRRVRPSTVVDIAGLATLRGITDGTTDGAGEVRIGALTRHRDLLGSTVVRERLGLLHSATGHIGHGAIRNRGTLGGSCASALPGAELPTALVALGATLDLVSATGRRTLPAAEFFRPGGTALDGTALDGTALGGTALGGTALRPGELVDSVTVPVPSGGTRWWFAEHTRRGAFKFPLVGVAVLRPPADEARVVVGGGTAGPVVVGADEAAGLALADLADRLALADAPQAGREFTARIARSLIARCVRGTEATR
jgi:aerobic carbon-monoxide dehydrogenase medium subunit